MRLLKRFKEENEITLYNGDCKKLLKNIPDDSVDIIFNVRV